jgi:hypothetical protein
VTSEIDADRWEDENHEGVMGWNLASMTEKHVEEVEKLWMEIAKERA